MNKLLCALISFSVAVSVCSARPDKDEDGIQDDLEQQLLNKFAPVLYTHEFWNPHTSGVGVPVNIRWLVQHSNMIRRDANGGTTLLTKPTLEAAVEFLQNNPNENTDSLHLSNPYKWGESPDDPRTWPMAEQDAAGTYGRAWIPWPGRPYIISLQYFMFLTWNETAYSFGWGNHEGDWLCIDIAVDTSVSLCDPPIIHAIYHNHGRQLLSSPQAIRTRNGRPEIFLEEGTNESWQHPGPNGWGGWAQTDGWGVNESFEKANADENKICRFHMGMGYRIDFLAGKGSVSNIGDMTPRGSHQSLSADKEEGQFILRYMGRYGLISVSAPFGLADADCPQGPPHYAKMWRRSWNGPWNPANFGPYETNWPGFNAETLPGYQFYVLVPSANSYVDAAAPFEGRGTLSSPFRSLGLGAAMTLPGGVVNARGGTYAGIECLHPNNVRITAQPGTGVVRLQR